MLAATSTSCTLVAMGLLYVRLVMSGLPTFNIVYQCRDKISSDTCQLVTRSCILSVPSVKSVTSFLLLLKK